MLWLLLVLFQVKHFLCDYPLQTTAMAMSKGRDWRALASHCAVHAVGTFAIAAPFGLAQAAALAAADFGLHALVDKVKADPRIGGRWNPSQPPFWWSLGADQMAHHVVNLGFAWVLVGS